MTSETSAVPPEGVPAVPHVYDGYYINLDRSVERRLRFEKQIASLGLSKIYRRFTAVDGSKLQATERLKSRSVGAFLSQRNVLAGAKHKKPFVHVLEDDTIFSRQMAPAICFAIEHGIFDRFDLIFTDIAVQADLNFIRILEANYGKLRGKIFADLKPSDLSLIDLSRVGFAGLPSFVLNAKCIDRLVAAYDREIARGPNIPIDLFIRKEIHDRRLRAACFFPFLSTVNFDDVVNTTTGRDERIGDTRLFLALLRYSYFIDCDLGGRALPVLEELVRQASLDSPDPHRAFLTRILGYMISTKFASL